MMAGRIALASLTALAVAACAPSGEGEGKSGPDPLRGFELATARDAETARAEVVEIDTETLAARLAQGNVRLIDVRTDEEVAEGVISGAEHIALDDFAPDQIDLSDGREVILYCRSGRRSGVAAERLSSFTGEAAVHLEGGILAWQEADKPLDQR